MLKAAGVKRLITYSTTVIQMMGHISSGKREEVVRGWDIFKVLKEQESI